MKGHRRTKSEYITVLLALRAGWRPVQLLVTESLMHAVGRKIRFEDIVSYCLGSNLISSVAFNEASKFKAGRFSHYTSLAFVLRTLVPNHRSTLQDMRFKANFVAHGVICVRIAPK
eukprot:TRINITY_DN11881_c0_g1_i1.p1 TRINITY_DN11881_c0_g1~~TRINITY_DN11881_c0_g1_i1.p1  ORF type:complete len:133 (+),score=13.65 TRINITY_DN11881_c0_g1_i1:54-401(+)